jgi:hypothetical protein
VSCCYAKNGASNAEILRKQDKIREILWPEKEVAAVLKKAGLDEKTADLGDLLDVVIRATEELEGGGCRAG